MNNDKVLLLYGRTNHHLGLWNDLENDSRVILRSTMIKQKSLLRRIYLGTRRRLGILPGKYVYYNYSDLFKIVPTISHLVIIDGALNVIEISELEKCRQMNPNLKIILYLINSINAQSPIMLGVRPKIKLFDWDCIYTFDKEDAKKYGYKYLGFCYYSSHKIMEDVKVTNDAYFVGGLKGKRENTIYDTYNHLVSNGVNCMFDLMPFGETKPTPLPGANFYRGWKPYEEILEKVQKSNCIIEICQHGQNGATLRYFEAVTMNKKLLTNNVNIVNFPFYNPKWMKIFSSVDDIDAEWVKTKEPIDYNYNGEFSPIHFIDYILSNSKKDTTLQNEEI